MICFINRSTVDYDIRLQKYVLACLETNTPYCVLGWDRLNNCSNVFPNEYQYNAYAPYGNGLKSFWPLIGWVFFVIFHLLKLRGKYTVIHACNLENCIISYIAKIFGKKMVLDIYDSQKPLLERKLAKILDGTILPSNQRLNQIGSTIDEIRNYLEIENVPVIKKIKYRKDEVEFPRFIHLSYVGVFQPNCRGIENLVDFVNKNTNVVLDIAGTGGGLDSFVNNAARINHRIRYYGKVDYTKALSIMSNSDFIVALYYLVDKDHVYASPNKYYESLALSKPIITSKGTLVGRNVSKNDTGYVIDDDIESIFSLFSDIGSSDFKCEYEKKVRNCNKLWEEKYANYFEQTLKGEYIHFIKKIALS